MRKSHPRSSPWFLLAASVAASGCRSGETEDGERAGVAPEGVGDSSGTPGVTTSGATGGGVSAGGNDVTAMEASGEDVRIVGGIGSGGAAASDGVGRSGGAGGSDGVGGTGEMVAAGGSMSEEDRIVLFDGTGLGAWISRNSGGPIGWQLSDDGSMVVTPGSGDIITRQEFEDVFVHVEYKTPTFPANVTGQARGNSGVYLKGAYEVQVLDSVGRPPEIDGCGAIYGIRAPLSVACRPQEVWNTYEIEFQSPRHDDQGNKLSNARMLSVTLNGVLVQDDVEVPGATAAGMPEAPGPAGILLQDHGNLVAFRNIWVIPR